MGLRCSCGVITNPVAITDFVIFEFPPDSGNFQSGTATYEVDACSDTVPLGNFSLVFVDTDGNEDNRSFAFNSTQILSVTCTPSDGGCNILVIGEGIVVGEVVIRSFNFTFNTALNAVLSGSITGFAFQAGGAGVPPDSIIALGCGTV